MKNNDIFYSSIILIFTAIGLISWTTYSQKTQLQEAKKEKSEMLKHYNKTLEYDVRHLFYQLEDGAMRRPFTTDFYLTMKKFNKILKPVITLIDEEHQLILKGKQINNVDSIIVKATSIPLEINQLLKELNINRRYNVKKKEYSKMIVTFFPIYKRIYSATLTPNSDLLSTEYQLLDLKNNVLRAGRELGVLLNWARGRALGCGGPNFWVSMIPSSVTYHPTVGKPFTTDIILSNQLVFQPKAIKATINGIPCNVKDGKIQYSVIPKTPGQKSYTVELKIDNPFTGKIDNCRKTFKFNVK